ncbi:zinc ABC transporter substrate-binding protein [Sphaerisporangium rufum]|uniref:Zinc ABC transporter substrate-binding protein n=1 Tax=Sphaerisporangium rufum TaxID=1381558 RepID=A0A919V2Y1_9ACTN|nr:zinc ABC transporter substrate-binding protein [Sphaerisporangium rufum]GII81179.1 zinc ABC transporter substrate-binding protein [Sphaerisporangium rufum]
MPHSSRYRRSSRPRTLAALLGAGALLAATACSPGTSAATGPAGDGPRVLAAFYPLEWLSARVAGPDAEVAGLTAPGVEPHDLELTPRQIADIGRADLVVYVKGLQPAVDEAVEQHAAGKAYDITTAAGTPLPAPPDGDHDDHDDPAGHDDEAGGHDEHGATDPHVWLDPTRLAAAGTELGRRLAAADSAHAAGYTGRAETTAGELGALDQEYQRGLANCAGRTILTAHAAFGHLANRYHLKQVAISGLDPEAEPAPARLAEAARLARQEKVTTIFTETLVSPKVAEVLAREIGARTAVLDPIESRPAQGDHLAAARANLSALRTALGCR